MDISLVKRYLRIDFDDDDELLELIASAARDYIIGAVGSYNEKDPLMLLLLCCLTQEMYDKRSYTVTAGIKRSHSVCGMVLQLQTKYDGADVNDSAGE